MTDPAPSVAERSGDTADRSADRSTDDDGLRLEGSSARWTLAVALLVLLLTPLAAGIQAVAGGWTPTGDQAIFLVRIHDTAAGHPPLTGMPSTASRADRPVDHPGPLAFWLAGPADRLAPAHGAGAVLTYALLNGLALAATVLVVRRAAGALAALVVAATLAWLVVGLAGPPLYQPWNAHLAILPTALLLASTWAVAAGDRRLLALQVAVASFVAQAHLAYLPLAVALTAVAIIGSWGARHEGTARAGRWAIAVGIACWSGPLVQQLTGRPGNLWAILTAGSGSPGEPVQGLRGALRAVVDAVGLPPRWGIRHVSDFDPVGAPGLVASLVTIALLAAAVALLVLALRGGRRSEAAALVTALVAVIASAAIVARLPADALTVGSVNSRRPLILCGWWLWIAVGASAARSAWPAGARSTNRLLTEPGPGRRVLPGLGAVVLVAALVVAGVVSVRRADPADSGGAVAFGAVRALTAAVPTSTIDEDRLLVTFDGASAGALTGPGVVAELLARGADVEVPRAQSRTFGRHHRLRPGPRTELLVVSGPDAGRPRAGYRLLATYDPADQAGTRWQRFDRSVFLTPSERSAIYQRTAPGR